MSTLYVTFAARVLQLSLRGVDRPRNKKVTYLLIRLSSRAVHRYIDAWSAGSFSISKFHVTKGVLSLFLLLTFSRFHPCESLFLDHGNVTLRNSALPLSVYSDRSCWLDEYVVSPINQRLEDEPHRYITFTFNIPVFAY